jgi:hypothetical protein
MIFLFFHLWFGSPDHVRHSYIDDSGMAPACLRKHTC